jgi:hypothetical protein
MSDTKVTIPKVQVYGEDDNGNLECVPIAALNKLHEIKDDVTEIKSCMTELKDMVETIAESQS